MEAAAMAPESMDDLRPTPLPVVMNISEDYTLRLDLLDSDNVRLKKELSDALRENARLKKQLNDARQDNTLLKDLAAKKER